MKNFYKGGRGLCLPNMTVETQCIVSLRPKQRNQGAPQNNVCAIRRGAPVCAPNTTPDRKGQTRRSAPTLTVLIMIFICCLFNNPALAQSRDTLGAVDGVGEIKPLRVGLSVPEVFWTREHLFYINGDTVRRTLEEHRGKILVLDFWFSGCTKCLLHQKEINYFKEKYPDELAVVMVNSRKTREDYQKIADYVAKGRFRNAGMESLESIIEDSYLESLFPYTSYPSYFWINRSGILQTHTFRNLLDRNYQAPFIENKR